MILHLSFASLLSHSVCWTKTLQSGSEGSTSITNTAYLGFSEAMASCPWVCWAGFSSHAYLYQNKGITDSAHSCLNEFQDEFAAAENTVYSVRMNFKKQVQPAYLSIFSISVPTIHCSCRKSMGEEDRSSRMGTSELSSILKSTFGSESVPLVRTEMAAVRHKSNTYQVKKPLNQWLLNIIWEIMLLNIKILYYSIILWSFVYMLRSSVNLVVPNI